MSDRYLRGAALVIGSLLICFTLIDYIALNWPFEFGNIQWRFGAVSSLGGSLMTPALGVLLLFAASVRSDGRGLRLTVTLLTASAVVVLAGASLMFGLDMLQLRASIRPEVLPRYDLESLRTVLKLGLGMVATVTITVFAFRSWRGSGMRSRSAPAAEAAKQSEPETTLIRPGAIARG